MWTWPIPRPLGNPTDTVKLSSQRAGNERARGKRAFFLKGPPDARVERSTISSMNIVAPAIALSLVGTLHLSATDIRNIQTPARLPKSITLAGIDYRASEHLKPWVAADPAQYAGTYESHTISDGSA